MATTIADIKFTVDKNLSDTVDHLNVIHWCNEAQTDFSLRVKIPKSTTLAINTTAISYNTLPTDILEFRRFRYQSDINNKINRAVFPVYSYYNGVFEVPTPFPRDDSLLIDYYSTLKYFTAITDAIDLLDRFKALYTTYIEAMYYTLPETQKNMPGRGRYIPWQIMYQEGMAKYQMQKKQVTDYYLVTAGVEKPRESGW